MKRSPTTTEASDTSAPTEGTQEALINDLLEEVFGVVMENLKPYHFKGSRTVKLVCRQWNLYINRNVYLPKKITKEDVVSSCHATEDASYVFNDENLLERLSFTERLQVASPDPKVVDEIEDQLQGQDLVAIGQKNIGQARRMLGTPVLAGKLSPKGRLVLTGYHPELVIEWLKNPTQVQFLLGEDLVDLCYDIRTLRYIISSKAELLDILTPPDLVKLCKLHFELALELLNNPKFKKLLEKLSKDKLIQVYINDASCVARLLADDSFVEGLSGDQLTLFVFKHEAERRHVISVKKLLDKLSGNNLLELGLKDEFIAEFILASDELRQKMGEANVYQLMVHIRIFKRFCQNRGMLQSLVAMQNPDEIETFNNLMKMLDLPEMQSLLNKESVTWEEIAPAVLRYQIDHPRVQMKVNGKKTVVYIEFANIETFIPTLIDVLKSPTLKTCTTDNALETLCLISNDAGKVILMDRYLYKKLTPSQIGKIGYHSLEYARIIFQTPELLEQLNPSQIRSICWKYFPITELVMRDRKLVRMLDVFTFEREVAVNNILMDKFQTTAPDKGEESAQKRRRIEN
ncbi:MAG: hypothetical protein ACHQJ6_08865 [Candidatus Berkiellales bacterium]